MLRNMETTDRLAEAEEPNPWTTEPTLGHATHILRTMSTFLAVAADGAELADPPLDDRELTELAAAAAEVVASVGRVVDLHSSHPALRVLEGRVG